MGGGFDQYDSIKEYLDNKREDIFVKSPGYNWGISPTVTNIVLKKCQESGTKIMTISSDFVRRNSIEIKREKIILTKASEFYHASPLLVSTIKDMENSNRGNKLTSDCKYLCDPLTFLLALLGKESVKTVDVDCSINDFQRFESYLKADHTVMTMTKPKDKLPNVSLIYDFRDGLNGNIISEMICEEIMNAICPHTYLQLDDHIKDVTKTTPYGYQQIHDMKFFSVHKNIGKINKQELIDTLEFPKNSEILQIIGDSVRCFSYEGSVRLQKYFEKELCEITPDGKILPKPIIIQWGLTGYYHADLSGSYGDINGIVNKHIDKFEPMSIANIVDYHTPKAISEWNCSISRLNRKFLLVHKENGAKFGDDTFMDSLCDRTICAEGGIQSFLQSVNILLMDKQIVFILGLRTDKNKDLFSCAEFFEMITDENVYNSLKDSDKQTQLLNQFYDWCIKTKTLFDSKSSDAGCKQALLDEAWTKFEQLIKTDFKQLCSFINLQ